MGGDVLKAGIAQNIFEGLMAAVAHEGAAGEAHDLALGVAVVDGDQGTALKRRSHALERGAEAHGKFDGDVGAVFEVRGKRIKVRMPFVIDGLGGLPDECAIAKIDAKKKEVVAANGGDVDREGIEEFVGEDNAGEGSGVLGGARVDGDVAKCVEVGREFSAAGAPFGDGESRRAAAASVMRADTGGDEAAEDGLELRGGEEVALRAEGVARGAVVAVLGVIEGGLHELGEEDWAVGSDARGENFGDGGHGWALSCCGLRVNISQR